MHRADPGRRSIDAVVLPSGGRIGMVACPGASPSPDAPADLDADLGAIARWGAEGIVTLVETGELEVLGVADIESRARDAGLWWVHLPIRDMCAPDDRFEASWVEEGARLRAGGALVLHCWAGLGRTGTVAARLLVELGDPPEAAIRLVREARRGAIQSLQQELHVHRCRRVDEA